MPAAIIIPAFNEQQTVADVVAAALPVGETIVVDDGSTDQTAARAQQAGARVIQLPVNRGKTEAIATGLRHTNAPAGSISQFRADTVVLLDADLQGLTTRHVQYMLDLYGLGDYGQVMGRVAGTSGLLTGQRVGNRRLWEAIASKASRWTFELIASQFGGPHGLIEWPDVQHRPKSEKYPDGILRQLEMWKDILLHDPWSAFQ